MGKQKRQGEQRGAAEEQSGVPLTATETRANQRPPSSSPGEPADSTMKKTGGMAGGASGAGSDEPGGSGQDDRS